MKIRKIILDLLKGAIVNFRCHRIGKCNICGNLTVFVCTDLEKARENMFCLFCRSSSRKRHVAKVVIERIFENTVSSIREIPGESDVKIYNTDTNDSFYKILHKHASYVCSEFSSEIEPGARVHEKVFNQNLENLTFQDESFDLVISEDVFEHVRNFKKGFREIYRVLKNGGYHIFTVPCNFDKKTIVRVDTSGDTDIHILPPEYHGGPIRGEILSYRTFGIDIFELLRHISFNTGIDFSRYADIKYGIVDSYVFVSKKV